MKVAIIGMSPSCADAPWNRRTWEKWGLPWHNGYWKRCDRLFEMHDLRLLNSQHSTRPKDYLDRLALADVPVWMQDDYLPNSIAYPFEKVAKSIGAAYWNSSIAYAMALAIHEKADEIGIWGVDMQGSDEYGYQKPNMEYLVGVARGKGIKVTIPNSSPLCKFTGRGIKFCGHEPEYIDRYGWLG